MAQSQHDAFYTSDVGIGTIWALTQDIATGEWQRRTLLLEAGAIVSFAEDTDGELFAIHYGTGFISAITAGGPEENCPPGFVPVGAGAQR